MDSALWKLILVIAILSFTLGENIFWKDDDILFTQISLHENGRQYKWNVTSNRYVLTSEIGHFILQFEHDARTYTTDCLSFGVLAEEMATTLNKIIPISQNGGVMVTRRGDGSQSYYYGYEYTFEFKNISQAALFPLEAKFGATYGCEDLVTYGEWSDGINWDGGSVPDESDTATIPLDSGQVVLTSNVIVGSLSLLGGKLVLHNTLCPNGYAGGYGDNTKCYAVSDNKRDWLDAQDHCDNIRPKGTGYLARISSESENQIVKLLCQGTGDREGCWIGLRRVSSADEWAWIGPSRSEMDARFRAWGEREPSNKTMSDTGERCAKMSQSRDSFFAQQGGFWEDDWCRKRHRYICELYGSTTSHSLTVASTLDWQAGTIFGAGILEVKGTLQISGDVTMDSRATLLNVGEATIAAANIEGMGGARLINQGSLTVSTDSVFSTSVNASVNSTNAGTYIPPILRNEQGGVMNFVDCTTTLSWVFENFDNSTIQVESEGRLELSGGGLLAGGSFTVDEDSSVNITAGALSMQNTDLFVLTLEADREVVEEQDTDAIGAVGAYRLRVSSENKTETTECIPYNATAEEVQSALENLPSVSSDGGVYIRRWGQGDDETWKYGYRYSIYFDEISSKEVGDRNLDLSCSGSESCHCADILGSVITSGSINLGCSHPNGSENTGQSSSTNSSLCILQPSISVEHVRERGESLISGGGRITVSNGNHLLSQSVDPDLYIVGGQVNFMAHSFSGNNIYLQDGVLMISGLSHEAEAAVNLLYANDSANGRTLPILLEPAPFMSRVTNLMITGGELRLVSTSNSTLGVSTFEWHGGNLSGLPTLEVGYANKNNSIDINAGRRLTSANGTMNATDTMNTTDTTDTTDTTSAPSITDTEDADTTDATEFIDSASLNFSMNISGVPNPYSPGQYMYMKNGVTLKNSGAGQWLTGSIRVSEGATFLNAGVFMVYSEDSFSYDDSRDKWSGQRDWKEKWYFNPLCGTRCERPARIINLPPGVLIASAPCNATLHASMYNYGQLIAESGAHLTLSGGGTNTADVLVKENGHLEISGGQFYFTPSFSIAGLGVVEFSGGSHTPPDTTECTMLLTGANVKFSAVRIKFIQGIIIHSGQMDILSTATKMNITGNLTLTGGLIQFPAIQENAAIHPIHLHSTHWTSDRSTLEVDTVFTWAGGTIKGNVDVISNNMLYILQNDKKLEGVAHVINRGKALWENGDIVHSSHAAFDNRGTLELSDPATFTSRVLQNDEQEVCCPTQKRAFFSWQ